MSNNIELCYIRFGEVPLNERSLIHRGDAILGEEAGVSVWECIYINGVYRLILPNPLNENAFEDIKSDFWNASQYKNRPVYKVDGDIVGYGSDGEPLLRNIRNIIKIGDCIQDIFKSDCKSDVLDDEDQNIMITATEM